MPGEGEAVTDLDAAIAAAHAGGTTDEFLEPMITPDFVAMEDGDALACFNFRADRVRQILNALLLPDFDGFDVSARPRFATALGMTAYSDALAALMHVAFAPQPLPDTLGQVLAAAGLQQTRLAETEKYPHVTFFFNGGVEAPNPGEHRILVPSPKIATYDLQPEMSAPEVGDRLVETILDPSNQVFICNFANPDMVGHTGIWMPPSPPVRPWTNSLAAPSTPMQRGGVDAGHSGPRQLRDHVGYDHRRPAYRPHHQSGAAGPVRSVVPTATAA